MGKPLGGTRTTGHTRSKTVRSIAYSASPKQPEPIRRVLFYIQSTPNNLNQSGAITIARSQPRITRTRSARSSSCTANPERIEQSEPARHDQSRMQPTRNTPNQSGAIHRVLCQPETARTSPARSTSYSASFNQPKRPRTNQTGAVNCVHRQPETRQTRSVRAIAYPAFLNQPNQSIAILRIFSQPNICRISPARSIPYTANPKPSEPVRRGQSPVNSPGAIGRSVSRTYPHRARRTS